MKGKEAWKPGRGGRILPSLLPCVASNDEPEIKNPWHKVACSDPKPLPGNLEVTKADAGISGSPFSGGGRGVRMLRELRMLST